MFNKDLENILDLTFQRARKKGHEYVSIEHILLHLLNNKEIISLFKALSIDCNVVYEELKKLLRAIPCKPDVQLNIIEPLPTGESSKILEKSTRNAQHLNQNSVQPLDVFIAIFQEKKSIAREFLQNAGIREGNLLRYLEHGIRKQIYYHDSDWSFVGVMVINDQFTPENYIIELLQSEFSLNMETVKKIMIQIQTKGKAFLGFYEMSEAREKTRKINTLSLKEGFPLMFVMFEPGNFPNKAFPAKKSSENRDKIGKKSSS